MSLQAECSVVQHEVFPAFVYALWPGSPWGTKFNISPVLQSKDAHHQCSQGQLVQEGAAQNNMTCTTTQGQADKQ